MSIASQAMLYFTTAGLAPSGYHPLHDDRTYDPLWTEVARLDIPVFSVQFGASPVGSYEDEMIRISGGAWPGARL